ncbi:hypothetical protein BX666DRAFT_261034 [Dichotomocladium elegans]|nr:hypothetical protein BX666DRAFT_261034 [Dichotomocladium elegans]
MDLRTQLVRNLNSRLSRRLPNILTGLDHHQFASTDEFCINHRWESLCEKFSIKGYGEAADRLRSLKSAFMDPAFSISDDACGTNSSQMVLKYDMLALLLALSSGIPAVGPSSECGRETAPETAAEFWKRTLAEEPLEGDHWKDYCEDSDDISFVSDDEDFEVDEEHLSRRRKARSSADPDMETYRGKSPTDERWDSVFSPMLEDNSFDPLLSGRKQQYWEQQGGSELLEAEVIREILFALRGYPGILFSQYAAAGNGITGSFQFKMENMSSTLRRVSNGAFISILQELNNSANTLLDLRQWSQRVLCDKSNTGMVKYGKTCEATAVCVTGMLLNFESRLYLFYSCKTL